MWRIFTNSIMLLHDHSVISPLTTTRKCVVVFPLHSLLPCNASSSSSPCDFPMSTFRAENVLCHSPLLWFNLRFTERVKILPIPFVSPQLPSGCASPCCASQRSSVGELNKIMSAMIAENLKKYKTVPFFKLFIVSKKKDFSHKLFFDWPLAWMICGWDC